jgi:hypothetical protein
VKRRAGVAHFKNRDHSSNIQSSIFNIQYLSSRPLPDEQLNHDSTKAGAVSRPTQKRARCPALHEYTRYHSTTNETPDFDFVTNNQ